MVYNSCDICSAKEGHYATLRLGVVLVVIAVRGVDDGPQDGQCYEWHLGVDVGEERVLLSSGNHLGIEVNGPGVAVIVDGAVAGPHALEDGFDVVVGDTNIRRVVHFVYVGVVPIRQLPYCE